MSRVSVTTRINRLSLLALALETMTCVMALLIMAQLKFNPSHIKSLVPYTSLSRDRE